MIDKQSDTWCEIEAFVQEQRVEAVESLIADFHSEQQRGIIRVLDALIALSAYKEQPKQVVDDYL